MRRHRRGTIVAADPGIDPSTRVAAAIAASPSPQAKERIREVAEVTASPRLRLALEAVAGEDHERLESALRALEDEARSQAS
jgi:hypothetical protein